MKRKYLFLFICVIGTLCSSCSETGLEGPEGPIGPQGKTGDAGAVGAAGKDGSIMYSGTGIPANTIGINGDYYLDKNTGNLYGPKTAGAWGTPTLLKGANGVNGSNGTNGIDGTNGTNGSTTLSGNGTPPATIGSAGDYFLDKTNYLLYGPKTASGWGIPILLRGAAGTQGPTGAAGKDGSIIYSGSGTPVATIGVNGDYYLDKNTGNLYGPKTVAAGWGTPLLLKGTNGTNGVDGTSGTNGTNGTNGSTTLSGNGAPIPSAGAPGDYYLDKTNYLLYGPKITSGWGIPILLRGADGAQGPTGPAGADGTIIYSGETAPDPTLGKNGDFYISRLPVALYGPKTATFGWGMGTSLKGADGANGTNGTNGSNGTNGTNGNAILNGSGPPMSTTGNNGDFYIDINTYTIYGPKTGGINWGYGTSLKGANGLDGNASVFAFETTDASTFDYTTKTNFFDGMNFKLRMDRHVLSNDTTSVFNIPASAAGAAQTGVVLVYLRLKTVDPNKTWLQLNYIRTDIPSATQFYTFNTTIVAGTTAVRIFANRSTTDPLLDFDKVRIVVTPASSTGTLSVSSPNVPMLQIMEKLNLQEKDFKKLK